MGDQAYGAWAKLRPTFQPENAVQPTATPVAPAAPMPMFNQGQSVALSFLPEQAPPMLPPQGGMPAGMQMPAGKGSGKGPSQMQMPMAAQAAPMAQAGPGNLNGADATMPQKRSMDLQALIQSLMSSGLLGGL